MKVFIVSAARTPITQYRTGAFANLSATILGSKAIEASIRKIRLNPEYVQEVIFGQVLQAGVGQAPARQAAIGARLPTSVICTTVNKVCSSGMKSIMLAAQTIKLGEADIIVAGGMESMSNAPYTLQRATKHFGHMQLTDSVMYDGLTDPYGKHLMGVCAENTCKKFAITRQEQDEFAKLSYTRAAKANSDGILAKEIEPIPLTSSKQKEGESPNIIEEDEEFKKIDLDKIGFLKPAFDREGTVTAANSSTLNDGAAATVIMSERALKKHNVEPLAEILSYADAECDPIDFPIAPSLSIPKALNRCNLKVTDVARWEINEAFSAVVLANIKILSLPPTSVNVNGGAVSLGHPIGMSGARIVNSLALHMTKGEIGVASICNGGGGASTVIVKKC